MNIESLIAYCETKKGVSYDTPFDNDTIAFRVGHKIFGLVNMQSYAYINLKSDPEKAIQLREQYPGITPGYHMSKKHWNSVVLNGEITDKLLKELIDDSYQLVFSSLTKKLQAEIEALPQP